MFQNSAKISRTNFVFISPDKLHDHEGRVGKCVMEANREIKQYTNLVINRSLLIIAVLLKEGTKLVYVPSFIHEMAEVSVPVSPQSCNMH